MNNNENIKIPGLEKFEQDVKTEVESTIQNYLKDGYQIESCFDNKDSYGANLFYLVLRNANEGTVYVLRKKVSYPKNRVFDFYEERGNAKDLVNDETTAVADGLKMDDPKLTDAERDFAKTSRDKLFAEVEKMLKDQKQPGEE